MSQSPIVHPSGSSPSTSSVLLNEFCVQHSASPCSSPLVNESDHSLSDCPNSPLDDSSKQENSDSLFWSSVPFTSENHFKSPTTKTINDLIESPIINKKIVPKKDNIVPARKLAFESPEIARVDSSSNLKMTSDSNSAVEFDNSPEAPKVLPRATRAQKMLERSNAANLMIRSSPQVKPNQSRASIPGNYRFGTKSQASFSTPITKSLSPQTSNQQTAATSPKRRSSLASVGSRGKAFLRALKNSEDISATENKDDDNEKQEPALVENEIVVLETPTKGELSNLKRKSILKQLNPTSEVLSSPSSASSKRINFRTPIVTEHLFDRFASAKSISDSLNAPEEADKLDVQTEDNEENVSLAVKAKNVAGAKRRRANDFTVVLTDNAADDDSANAISADFTSAVSSESCPPSYATTPNAPTGNDGEEEEEEPKKKVCKKLNKLFDEIEDWTVVEVNQQSNSPQTSPSTFGDEQVAEQTEPAQESIVNEPEVKPSEDDMDQKNSQDDSLKERLQEEEKKDEKEEKEKENDDSNPKQPSESIAPKEPTTINRVSFGVRTTRAMAMVSSVMGSRAAQILVPAATSSPPVKSRPAATFAGNSPIVSPVSRLSRSYALVQASKKKHEDLVKSISEAASQPDLFETPQKSTLEKRSCLKSSDSEKRESRRLSFAKSVVTDQLYYCISEPSSCVAEALSLRKQAASAEENLSSDSSIEDSSQQLDENSAASDNAPVQNEESVLSPIKRRVLRQSSIISNDQDEYKDEEENFLDKSIDVSNDDYVPETDEDDEDNVQDNNSQFNETLESENENSLDSQTIADEMRTLAQDLTGHDVSNLSETSAFKIDLSNVDSYDADVTANFSSDDSLSAHNDTCNKDDGDNVNEVDITDVSHVAIQGDESTDDLNDIQSDVSDSCYKDASSIFEDITLDSTNDDSDSSYDSPNASEFPENCSRQRIIIDDRSPLSQLTKEQLDNEPKVKLELPLSVARYVFDLLKVSLEPFNES